MSSSTSLASPMPTIEVLSEALKVLQTTLQPLLGQPLHETIFKLEQGKRHSSSSVIYQDQSVGTGNGLEGLLDAAKLYTAVAYVLLDLAWMRLRVTGQDPASHPVTAELDRVKSYFSKIKFVQSGQANASSSAHASELILPGRENQNRLDQAAAGRFVRNALAAIETGKHTKFEYSNENPEHGISERQQERESAESSSRSSFPSMSASDNKQRVRKVKDPFEGYDGSLSSSHLVKGQKPQKKRKVSASDGAQAELKFSATSQKLPRKERKEGQKKIG